MKTALSLGNSKRLQQQPEVRKAGAATTDLQDAGGRQDDILANQEDRPTSMQTRLASVWFVLPEITKVTQLKRLPLDLEQQINILFQKG